MKVESVDIIEEKLLESTNRSIILDGQWQAVHCKHGLDAFDQIANDEQWFSVDIPGDVHLALWKRGKIENPYFSDNFTNMLWLEERDWWFQREFRASERKDNVRYILVFEGLDTFATVWLNGKKIGCHDNMFVPLEIDISEDFIPCGTNQLVVKLSSAIKSVTPPASGVFRNPLANYESLPARKMAMSYGWDTAPRMVTCGIFRTVRIEERVSGRISDLFVCTRSVENEVAIIDISVEVEADSADLLQAELYIEGVDIGIPTIKCEAVGSGVYRYQATIMIAEPKLWWPAGYGEPHLYCLCCRISENGTLLSEKSVNFGIRTVRLVQDSYADKKWHFYFEINGVAVFAKGANWVPVDVFPFVCENSGRERELLLLAKKAGMNMIRVWGGGKYETELFYNLCDQEGIMVWQDFMFACSDYPEDVAFVDEVKNEVTAVVNKLRNHPSLIMWCGNNECEMVHEMWCESDSDNPIRRCNRKLCREKGSRDPKNCYQPGFSIFNKTIPEILQALDPSRPYHSSSPSSADGFLPSYPFSGDTHNWGIFFGATIFDPVYSEEQTSFASEYGFLALPSLKTMRSICDEKHLWPLRYLPKIKYHAGTTLNFQPDPNWFEIMEKMVATYGFPEANCLEEHILHTQYAQALSLAKVIGNHRSSKYDTGGTLLWNLNDQWPNITPSLIDYYLFPKIAYYLVQHVYADPAIFFIEKQKEVQIWCVSDSFESDNLSLVVEEYSSSELIRTVMKKQCAIDADSATCLLSVPKDMWGQGFFCARLLRDTTEIARSLFSSDLKSLINLPPCNIQVKTGRVDEFSYRCTVHSEGLTPLLGFYNSEMPIYCSYNFFHLLPGEKKSVLIRSPQRLPGSRLSVCSLNRTKEPLTVMLSENAGVFQ
jgi:beta-mannosidase